MSTSRDTTTRMHRVVGCHAVPSLSTVLIRPLRPDDDLQSLTGMIHEAYAHHVAAGLRYVGTDQTVETTRARLAAGEGFVAVDDRAIVGTVTLRAPQPASFFIRRTSYRVPRDDR